MTLADLLPKLHYPTRLEKLVDGWVHGVGLMVFTFAVGIALGLAIWQGGLSMASAVAAAGARWASAAVNSASALTPRAIGFALHLKGRVEHGAHARESRAQGLVHGLALAFEQFMQLHLERGTSNLLVVFGDDVDAIEKGRLDRFLPAPERQRVIAERTVVRVQHQCRQTIWRDMNCHVAFLLRPEAFGADTVSET